MKALKYLFGLSLVAFFVVNCTDDDNDLSFVDSAVAPSNISALFQVTQDNTGLVTITPSANGAASFNINFGDGTEELAVLGQGENVEHTYAEGSYSVVIEAVGITGLKSEVTQELVVSFKPPENLDIVIENDPAISKQVNVTANADFAVSYDVDFGDGSDILSANIGDVISYVYAEAGTYTITIVVMGAAIETTEYTEDFEVTEILQPIASASVPPARGAQDVISIFSDAYDDIMGTDFNPDWAQATIFTAFDLNGDAMLQYSNLNYQGIDIGENVDASNMEFLHIDIWTADATSIDIYPLPNGVQPEDERFVSKDLVPDQWNSFDIPMSDFTSQGLPIDNLKQFKFVGAGTIFIDNLYFWKQPDPASGVEGVWIMAPEAGSLGVGPAVGDMQWFSCDAGCVTTRACYFDDTYVFTPDGSFFNVLGTETWVEGWQGGGDACGAPVAPHDGSAQATYVYDDGAGTITLNGTGAYLGIPKAVNAGELPGVPVPGSITYNVTLTDNNNTMNVYIESGGGVFWQYKLVRYTSPLVGTWKMAPEAGSLGVGPAPGDTQWFACDAGCVTARACYFDDTYVFGSDSSFSNVLGTESWIEPWQGGSDACGTPVAPHDGSGLASFVYDESNGKVTLNGTGAYIGLPKAVNAGELSAATPPPVPDAITYEISFIDANTISVYIESGTGVFWQYKLIRE